MNKIVNFELAKLLKEKGFNEPVRLCYAGQGSSPLPFDSGNKMHRNNLHPYESAPIITDVIMWLYEKHGIWIYVKLGYGHEYVIQSMKSPYSIIHTDGTYNSITDAYEAGIEYSLKNLI